MFTSLHSPLARVPPPYESQTRSAESDSYVIDSSSARNRRFSWLHVTSEPSRRKKGTLPMRDLFTRFNVAVQIPDKTTQTAGDTGLGRSSHFVGAPARILSDQKANFQAVQVKTSDNFGELRMGGRRHTRKIAKKYAPK